MVPVSSLTYRCTSVPDQLVDFQRAFDALPGSFLLLEPDAPKYTILAISNELLRSTAQARPKVVGRSVFEVYPENPAASTATGPSTLRVSLQNVIQLKKPDQMPVVRYDVPDAEGVFEARYWLAHTQPVLNAAGEVQYLIHSTTDVTDQNHAIAALRESEERFRIMADAAPNMVWAINPDSSIRYINRAFLEFVGVSQEQYLATGWAPYMYPEELERAQDFLTNSIAQRLLYSLEHRMLRHDGQYRWLLAQGSPSYYPNGELYGYVGSAIDITELKQANEQLIRTNNDLDNFVYTASHDLKAPISNIEGLLQALLRTLPPETMQSERVQRLTVLMQESIERFTKTIANLTDVVKLQKEHGEETATVSLHEVIQDVCFDLEPLRREVRAQVEVEVDACSAIRFSAKNLRSVVYNLLSNALKYHAPGRPPRVVLQGSTTREYYVLTVSDNGLGIAAERQSQLFTMFKRFHDHVEGSGIGLYMVK